MLPAITALRLRVTVLPSSVLVMTKYSGEQVLVVSRALIDEMGSFQGIQSDHVETWMERILDSKNHFFMDRGVAEEDPTHKQLIPYCVFRYGSKILHYTRGKSGGESRLHAKISVGVGGHINPIDTGDGRTGPQAYYAAVARELEEELEIKSQYNSRIIALLNDDSNTVGQVHLGVVHLLELDGTEIASREDALSELTFTELSVLRGEMFERLETWSQHCIAYLFANFSA